MSPRQTVLLLALPLLLASCREAQVATYRIPKENDPHPPAAAAAAPAPMGADTGGLVVASTDAGGLSWTAPAAWKAKPGSAMRKGSYTIGAEGGPAADLAITAFPGDVGGDLANLNRWRGQLALPPVTEAEFAGAVTRLTVNGLSVTLADVTGGGDNPQRLLGAMVPHAGATWFFKLTGPAALVAAEKPAFLSFVQTLSAP